MSDEKNKNMVGEETIPSTETAGTQEPTPYIDPWEEAFGALERKNEKPSEGTEQPQPEGAAEGDSATQAADATQPNGDTTPVPEGNDGGRIPPIESVADTDAGESGESFDPADRVKELTEQIETVAITQVEELFLNAKQEDGSSLIRQTNGVLGATMNDPDIFRRDENGIPTFYNPETGRPFTGDNPRAQARQWVEEYNNELRETFNKMANEKVESLRETIAPSIALIEFIPTYENLDPVRKNMLDAIIEDYEVYDDKGEHIGYSVDLDKTLAQVNKQIASIQAQQAQAAPAQTAPAEKPAPSGPAVDMPATGSNSSRADNMPKSFEEAMLMAQDAKLEALRNK